MVKVERAGKISWSKTIATGDLRARFFGAVALSFGDGVTALVSVIH
jgi:hypothetical protein